MSDMHQAYTYRPVTTILRIAWIPTRAITKRGEFFAELFTLGG